MPHTREESKEVARGIIARATAALEPYILRAGDAALRARDNDGEALERLAAEMGVDAEELEKRIDVEGSLQFSAITELVADLMHRSAREGLDWQSVLRAGYDIYRGQSQHLQRFLVYEAPDEESQSGVKMEVWEQ